MEAYERIRRLRKKILNMTLEEFSSKINISRSNLVNIETGRIRLTERVILDICRAFGVRQDWISNGIEPIFKDGEDPLDAEISKLYLSLTDENKKYLYGYMQRLLEEQRKESNSKETERSTPQMTVEEAEAKYIKSRSKFVQNVELTALNTIEDTDNKIAG